MFKTHGIFRTIWNIYDEKFCKNGCLAHFSASALKKFPWKNLQKILLWKNSYIFSIESFIIFSQKMSSHFSICVHKNMLWNIFLYFLKKASICGNGNIKKILIFQETESSYTSGSNFPRSKAFYTFSYKEGKVFKWKYFLIIVIRHFFTFYDIFSILHKLFFFLLPRYFLVVFLCILDNI